MALKVRPPLPPDVQRRLANMLGVADKLVLIVKRAGAMANRYEGSGAARKELLDLINTGEVQRWLKLVQEGK